MKRIVLSALGGFALMSAAPLWAQDEGASDEFSAEQAELEQFMSGMATLFPKEPLTADEQARLPQAERIIALMIPEGAMGDIMGKMIDDIALDGPLFDEAFFAYFEDVDVDWRANLAGWRAGGHEHRDRAVGAGGDLHLPLADPHGLHEDAPVARGVEQVHRVARRGREPSRCAAAIAYPI